MPEARKEADQVAELEKRVIYAFRSAYPDVPSEKIKHMARNFAQVIQGIIEIGSREGDKQPTHMDVANGIVYWCVASFLKEPQSEDGVPVLKGVTMDQLSDDDVGRMLSESVARVADWLLGLEVLREDQELYRNFVIGSVALGASGWEKSRSDLNY